MTHQYITNFKSNQIVHVSNHIFLVSEFSKPCQFSKIINFFIDTFWKNFSKHFRVTLYFGTFEIL